MDLLPAPETDNESITDRIHTLQDMNHFRIKENMSMKLSKDELLKVADLARIEMTEQEVLSISKQVSDILGYIEILEKADTNNINPTSHDMAATNVFRDDTVIDTFNKEKALANAPRAEEDHFVVPKSIG